jgi:hypothetical protein
MFRLAPKTAVYILLLLLYYTGGRTAGVWFLTRARYFFFFTPQRPDRLLWPTYSIEWVPGILSFLRSEADHSPPLPHILHGIVLNWAQGYITFLPIPKGLTKTIKISVRADGAPNHQLREEGQLYINPQIGQKAQLCDIPGSYPSISTWLHFIYLFIYLFIYNLIYGFNSPDYITSNDKNCESCERNRSWPN